ncbi:hypothetical protein GCM10010492_77160 [Saccharothrix mutabilis subsp. mutabilis]|uniref:Uncharacterized protein n=1 Tax=Saccharothrix mutabilis subsp. mutabilis TaxID=66855 RepID=A0ABP3EKH4_9PSEU
MVEAFGETCERRVEEPAPGTPGTFGTPRTPHTLGTFGTPGTLARRSGTLFAARRRFAAQRRLGSQPQRVFVFPTV